MSKEFILNVIANHGAVSEMAIYAIMEDLRNNNILDVDEDMGKLHLNENGYKYIKENWKHVSAFILSKAIEEREEHRIDELHFKFYGSEDSFKLLIQEERNE